MPNVCVYTLGCKSNQYEGKKMTEELVKSGCKSVGFFDSVDFYVINTCTVTAHADKKCRNWIRKAKKTNPTAKILATGCYLSEYEIGSIIYLKDKNKITEFINSQSKSMESNSPEPETRVRENLMIENGCNQFCSYCIVPYARGSKIETKPIDQIVMEAEELVSRGARELILTGINLGLYGSGNLVDVIEKLTNIPDLLRLRLSSIEPMFITDGIIETVAQNPKACKHFHIPLQSGDNDILKKMNRNYTMADYNKIIKKIRSCIPDAGITTDIIIGFPGEGAHEFNNSVAATNYIGFSRIHIFRYSKRPGTAAFDYESSLSSQEVNRRYKIMDNLRSNLMKDFHERYLNSPIEILVESAEKKLEGLTSNYIRVLAPGAKNLLGKLIKVNALKAEKEHILGVVTHD